MSVSTDAANFPYLLSGSSLPAVGFADAWNPSTLSLLATNVLLAATAPPQSARNSAVEAMTIAGDGRILSR